MKDLINRREAIDAIKKYRNESDMPDMWNDGMSCALRCLYKLPSAQPERKTGRWKLNIRLRGDVRECDINYCPMCGRRLNK